MNVPMFRGPRAIAVAAAALVAAAVGGCGSGGSCGAGAIAASWTVPTGTCAGAGATEVDIYVDGVATQFTCDDLGGTIPASGGHSHTVSAKLFDAGGNSLDSTTSISVTVPCSATATLPVIDFACASGAVDVAWTVSASGATVSCEQAGATEVDIVVDGSTTAVNCTDMEDTFSVPGGVNHTVSATLRDSSGNELSSVSPMTVFVSCNMTYTFPPIDFSLTP
jgi:hypothetical protein